MSDPFEILSEAEIDYLARFLLDRIPEDADAEYIEGIDEGILGVSELDGFFTAIVSGPVMIPPSKWLPAVWGEYQPVWEDKQEFEGILTLLMRHMNAISATLMEHPEEFEALFLERVVKGETFTIVDEWCEGYLRGVALAAAEWDSAGPAMAALLAPIRAFTEATHWRGHDLGEREKENTSKAIETNVRKIHAWWLKQRSDDVAPSKTVRRSTPQVGRNDPCPCGSGKKYKKCCLH